MPTFGGLIATVGVCKTSSISNAGSAHTRSLSQSTSCRNVTRGGYAKLRSQLTSATDSIGDNIVEGCDASTKKDFARFLDNSIKSANETEGHLLKVRDLELISIHEWQKYSAETIEVRKMVFGYRRKLLASDAEEGH